MPKSGDRTMNDNVRIGVLALQGGFAAHRAMLARLGVDAEEVRHPEVLERLDGLIIPGGESTTLLKLMDLEPRWWPALEAFHRRGGSLFGTCAGLIMLAKAVTGPAQRSLGYLDVDVERNAYGRQVDSSEGIGAWEDGRPLEMVYIRAPRITRLGEGIEVLARRHAAPDTTGDPVLVEHRNILAASFHPELTDDPAVHRHFVGRVRAAGTGG